MFAGSSRYIHLNDIVRVLHDVPQVGLRRGEIGVVQSRWFAPKDAFEVEFHAGGLGLPLRVILDEEDLEPAVAPAADVIESDSDDGATPRG